MDITKWIGIALMVVAIICRISNKWLIIHYINKFDPHIMDADLALGPLPDGEYRWEKTAGTGIVPKWVSLIALLHYPTLIISGLLLLIWFIFGWLF